MIAAFRYSLGRKTYMPHFIVDCIINNQSIFNKTDWERFIGEINDAGDLGDTCDIQSWNNLIHFCESKIKTLKNEN